MWIPCRRWGFGFGFGFPFGVGGGKEDLVLPRTRGGGSVYAVKPQHAHLRMHVWDGATAMIVYINRHSALIVWSLEYSVVVYPWILGWKVLDSLAHHMSSVAS